VVRIVQRDAEYVADFRQVQSSSQGDLSIDDIASALAAFERTLVAGESAFDRYEYAGDRSAISESALRGLELFRGRARCAECHQIGEGSAALTDHAFHPAPTPLPPSVSEHLGALTDRVVELRRREAIPELNTLIASDPDVAALGRFVVTLDPKDIGCFKTPSLRNVALTGPYMHDGSIATLPEAIELELYSRTGSRYPLVLTQDEQRDLLQIVRAFASTPGAPPPAGGATRSPAPGRSRR
jgi:cytochrome c peroxidase